MGLEQYLQEPTIIEGDNLQANRWASSDLITTGNKFIERDYFKVKEWIEAGYLEPSVVKCLTRSSSRSRIERLGKRN